MQLYSNNGQSTLSANVLVGDVTLFVQPGHGARFPTIAGANFFYVTLESAGGAIEIVKVTTHTVGSTAMTVTRAQQGTTALAWSSGDLIELRATAAELAAFEADIDDLYVQLAALDAAKANLSGNAYTGYHNFLGATTSVVTKAPGDNTNSPASTAFVVAQILAATLPGQAGNAGKFITTNGTVASWADIFPAQAGNAGKYFVTDGTTPSWVALPA